MGEVKNIELGEITDLVERFEASMSESKFAQCIELKGR